MSLRSRDTSPLPAWSTSANPNLQPIVEKYRPQIEKNLEEIKDLKALQKTLTADKQKATQDLRAALKRLKELVIFLRAAIRGDIGPRTEKPGGDGARHPIGGGPLVLLSQVLPAGQRAQQYDFPARRLSLLRRQ